MSRVLTILEPHVPQARQAELQSAYRSAADEAFPPGLVRSALLQATTDRTLWRIETLWESREVLNAMRGTATRRSDPPCRGSRTDTYHSRCTGRALAAPWRCLTCA